MRRAKLRRKGMSEMRVLVTGGGGFLGSHICDELTLRGASVVVLDLVHSPWLSEGQEMVVADVADKESLDRAMRGCDAVFHCAAVADLDAARADPRKAIEINVLGTLSVLESAAEAGVSRFVHASSVYVLSRSGSVYRTSKMAAENVVQDIAGQFPLAPTILRFGSLYGPRADPGNAILRMVRQAVLEGRIDFWGDGSEVREYIHIRDAAALAVDSVAGQYAGQTLHIAGRERLSTIELLETINEMLGGGLEITLQDRSFEGRYHLTPYSFESTLGRRIVGNTYVDLGLGVLETIRLISESDFSSNHGVESP
jgi:UDP-glucose 4-epimerase